MISKLYYIETDSLDPYHNIALEEYLLDTLPVNSMTMYLWQNERTVVIGRNQSSYNEVNIQKLEEDGGHLARRLSGGGAVYHDTGNLNFTFITSEADFDLTKQDEVILNALRRFNIKAEVNGRNDLTIDGRKFSGHAYYHTNKNSLHHGTIMVSVNENSLTDYLDVSKKKLASKKVESVRSRIINLNELNSSITVNELKNELIMSFIETYDANPTILSEEDLDKDEIRRRAERFASEQWKYDKPEAFDKEQEQRFLWGTVTVKYSEEDGLVSMVAIYTDSLNTNELIKLPSKLKGRRIDSTLYEIADNDEERDVISLLLGG